MDLDLFLRGMIIGFSIAAPVGPIGVLCIRRTLAHGRLNGFVSGLGAATADAFYGSLAGLGLTSLSALFIEQEIWLRLVGGLLLAALGIKTLLAAPAAAAAGLAGSPPGTGIASAGGPPPSEGLQISPNGLPLKNLGGAYLSTLFLTLANPATILAFTAIIAGLGRFASGPGPIFQLVSGVFLGSAVWWLVLSSAADFFRVRFLTAAGMRWINRFSGLVLLIFAALALSGAR